MKKFIRLIGVWMLACTLLFAVSGCKRFLDRKPLTATLDDLKQGALESQALGMYNTLRSYVGFSGLPWLDFHSIRDDDAQKGSSTTDGAEINAEFESFQYTKDDWATNTYWNDHYYMINLANKLLYYADSLKATDAVSKLRIGEAHFFRAYSYFELVKAYGEVPLINFYYVNAKDGIRPKSTVPTLYKLIDSDLTVATHNLPLNWAVGGNNGYPGRVTSGTANTLWAQTFLFRKQWDSVIKYCNAVVTSGQYQLDTSFVEIWKDGLNGSGKNGVESIFEMQANVGQSGKNYNGVQWGTSQQVRQGGAPNTWNLGWGWNVPTENLVSAWDNTDPRKSMTILYSGQSDGGPATGGYGATLPPYNKDSLGVAGYIEQPYWNKKLYSDPQMRAYTGEIGPSGAADWINHRIYRYADVLLMLAEAANEKGDGATAEANLEKVRARARNHNNAVLPHIAFVSQSQMRQAIKDERRWEFAMEGYRFYDLVRWGDANSVLGSLGYTDKCQYYPIPQQAINLSGNVLVQNPNWQ